MESSEDGYLFSSTKWSSRIEKKISIKCVQFTQEQILSVTENEVPIKQWCETLQTIVIILSNLCDELLNKIKANSYII